MDLHSPRDVSRHHRRQRDPGQGRLGALRAVERRARRQGDARGRRRVLHREGRVPQPPRHQGRVDAATSTPNAHCTTIKTKPEDDMKRMMLALLALGAAALFLPATAQDKYPSKPVRVLVPYAPGGATDIITRVLGDQLRQSLGQSFVTENKPGAFGITALEEMARSKPDGSTLMIGNVSTNAITPVLYKDKLKIDFDKDVVSVGRLATLPSFLIVTTKNFAPRSVTELVAYAKANPDKVRYGSAGIGSFPHFDM